MHIEKSIDSTIFNLETHLKENKYAFTARSFSDEEAEDVIYYIAEANYRNCKAYIKFVVDKTAELLTVSFFPGICVAEEYLPMASQYITSLNNSFKYGAFYISSNGAVSSQVSQSFSDRYVSTELIKTMVMLVAHMSLDKYREIDKAAHGLMLCSERNDVQTVAENVQGSDEITLQFSDILDDMEDMCCDIERKSEEIN